MPIDASIYQNIRPFEMPSYADSAAKAANLSQLGMQQAHLAKKMQQEDKDANYKNLLQRNQVFGTKLGSILNLPPEKQGEAYLAIKNDLEKNKIVEPGDMPDQLDLEGFVKPHVADYHMTKDYLDKQETQAKIKHYGAQNEKLYAEAKALGVKSNSNKAIFDNLPPENQEQIKDLAKATANKDDIRNHILSNLELLKSPQVDEAQKIVASQNILKTLNSAEGKDAVGSEESKRLGSFLEPWNVMGPGGPRIGRDLDGFTDQVALKAEELNQSISRNRAQIDKHYGRTSGGVVPIDTSVATKNQSAGLVNSAYAGGNGKDKPDAKIDEYARTHKLDYNLAKNILVGRGYVAK